MKNNFSIQNSDQRFENKSLVNNPNISQDNQQLDKFSKSYFDYSEQLAPPPTFESNLDKEYMDYRKSLMFFHECAACHYAQGMIFFGIGFFAAIRMHFIWQELNWKQVIKYSAIILSTTSHVFQAQGKMKKYNQLKEESQKDIENTGGKKYKI
jgi:hypothetical protein